MVGVTEAVYDQGKIVAYRPERFGRRQAAKPTAPTPAVVHVSYDQ
jgi:hypothetical protein